LNTLLKRLKNIFKRKIVYTCGVYDLCHRGHINILNRAKEQGEFLIVGVVGDTAVKLQKGENRPIQSCIDRLNLVQNLKSVDLALYQEDFNPRENLEILKKYGFKVDLFVRGEDQAHIKLDFPYEIEIVTLERTPNVSTSNIVERINK
jgi:cytidyltransferase-like protein